MTTRRDCSTTQMDCGELRGLLDTMAPQHRQAETTAMAPLRVLELDAVPELVDPGELELTFPMTRLLGPSAAVEPAVLAASGLRRFRRVPWLAASCALLAACMAALYLV